MPVYAGIDEAGYGPLLGPMVVGCAALRVPKIEDLWETLHPAVSRNIRDAKKHGGLAVADSKALTGSKAKLKHLSLGALAFAGLGGDAPEQLESWLEMLRADAPALPWYQAGDDDWPVDTTAGEAGIARGMLKQAAQKAGVECLGLRAGVICEDTYNQMVGTTHNKALVSWHYVARHLWRCWQAFGDDDVFVAVDRQGGRKDYRDALRQTIPDATLTEGRVDDAHSGYRLEQGRRRMTVVFETKAEDRHLPTALASMVSKLTREALMRRFNAWWGQQVPGLKPTKGYGSDGKRWCQDVGPHLNALGIRMAQVRRASPGI